MEQEDSCSLRYASLTVILLIPSSVVRLSILGGLTPDSLTAIGVKDRMLISREESYGCLLVEQHPEDNKCLWRTIVSRITTR